MLRQTLLAIVAVHLLGSTAVTFADPTIASYGLKVEVMWDQDDHEWWAQSFSDVVDPHFSHLGGVTHNSDLSIWAPGGTVVPGSGMELMQESGWIDHPDTAIADLAAEFETHISDGDAWSMLNWAQAFSPGNSTDLMFDISSTHPLITINSMIGPSPDWFIGVSGLNLSLPVGSANSTDGWSDSVVVDLYAYDGGSEDGDESFSLGGSARDSDAYRAISLISSTPDATAAGRTALNGGQIGRFTFTLNTVAVPEPSAHMFLGIAAICSWGIRWLKQRVFDR